MSDDAETDRDLWEAQANHLYEANRRMKRQIEEYEDEIREYKQAHPTTEVDENHNKLECCSTS